MYYFRQLMAILSAVWPCWIGLCLNMIDLSLKTSIFLQERASYLEYQKVMREVEHLSRLYIAHQFVMAEVK